VAPPTFSLVVCTYRRPTAVGRLLDALALQTQLPQETLIVDASPDAATAAVVAQRSLPGLRHLPVPEEHRGLTRQRNWAVPKTRGDLVAFLDDDAVPEPDYLAEVVAAFARHPEASGIAGYVVTPGWRPAAASRAPLWVYRWGDWERREDLRWRLRRLLGLVEAAPPGMIPPSGHGRSLGFVPPDGEDHDVEMVIGAAMSWRREVLETVRFSSFFEGYGLYEDLDFAIRARVHGPIVLATRARVRHDHEPAGRPSAFRYGRMVVRNGWLVWRRRWPQPPLGARCRWWATTLVLAGCQLLASLRGDGGAALFDGLGRLAAVPSVLLRPPRDPQP